MTLLRLAATNRLALGKREEGLQRFALPGVERWEQIDVQLDLARVLSLKDFADLPTGRS